jgi:hypothetical protein
MGTNLNINGSGHFVQESDDQRLDTIVSGENLGIGSVPYLKAADSKAWKHDGTEAAAAALLGVCDAAAVAPAVGSIVTEGNCVVTGPLVPGTEYFAKEDGTLDIYANIGAGQWTRSMGVAMSATSLRVHLGPVIQHP